MIETVIIDGNHSLSRMAYVKDFAALATSTGIPTGQVMGFLNSLHKAMVEFTPKCCTVVWDDARSKRRMTLLPTYKQRPEPKTDEHRAERDERQYRFRIQKKLLTDLLPKFAVRQLQLEGHEGDDVLALLCQLIPGEKLIISEDKDLWQLLDKDVSIFRPIKREVITNDLVIDELGLPLKALKYLKALSGDDSDNIPGVPGVGEVTATKLLLEVSEFTDASVKAAAEASTSFRCKKIIESWDTVVLRNLELVDLAKISFTDEERQKALQLAQAPVCMAPDKDLFQALGALELNNILEHLGSWIVPFRRLV